MSELVFHEDTGRNKKTKESITSSSGVLYFDEVKRKREKK